MPGPVPNGDQCREPGKFLHHCAKLISYGARGSCRADCGSNMVIQRQYYLLVMLYQLYLCMLLKSDQTEFSVNIK